MHTAIDGIIREPDWSGTGDGVVDACCFANIGMRTGVEGCSGAARCAFAMLRVTGAIACPHTQCPTQPQSHKLERE